MSGAATYATMSTQAAFMKPAGRRIVNHRDGDNSDIIDVTVRAAKQHHAQAKAFAMATMPFVGDRYEACRTLWNWLKTNIRYQIDPPGVQWIKTPAQVVSSGFTDCKSFSVFISSVLRHWNIPHVMRFTSKSGTGGFTHVFVVATIAGREVPIDPVWHQFDSEHDYQRKTDIPMRIETISGIGAKSEPANRKINLDTLTEAQLSLKLEQQRYAIKRDQAMKLGGPRGKALAQKYATRIVQAQNLEKAAIQGPEFVDAALDDIAVGGIGFIRNMPKPPANATNVQRTQQRPSDKKPRLQKLGEKIKQGAQAAIKVATTPARLAAKAALELLLPKSAMFFKYLFVTNPNLIAKLPPKAREKRKKAEKIAKFITDGIGMKDQHFMGIIRNGILKQSGMEPERLLEKELGGKVNGIGFVVEAFEALVKLIGLIAKAVGKDGPKVSKEDFPDTSADGFGAPGTNAATAFGADIAKQKGDELDDEETNSGGTKKSIC